MQPGNIFRTDYFCYSDGKKINQMMYIRYRQVFKIISKHFK